MNTTNTTVAEWVLPGHPDKLCDALADRIVGEVLRADPYGQCGIEAACAFDHVFVTGLIGFDRDTLPDIEDRLRVWVRDTYRTAGYGGRWDPLPDKLRIDLQALHIEQRGSEWQELRHLSDDSASASATRRTPRSTTTCPAHCGRPGASPRPCTPGSRRRPRDRSGRTAR